jgi:hypothetical protein
VVVTERSALELGGVRAETVMHIVGIWAQLAGRELEAGRLTDKERDRLRIALDVLADWQAVGGRTGLPRVIGGKS